MARNKNQRKKPNAPSIARLGYIPHILRTFDRTDQPYRLLVTLDKLCARKVNYDDPDSVRRFDRQWTRTTRLLTALGYKHLIQRVVDAHNWDAHD